MRKLGWSRTDTGVVRDHNEDAHLVDNENAVFVVADGVGGSSKGELASQMLVEHLAEALPEIASRANAKDAVEDRSHREEIFAELTRSIQRANAEIYERGRAVDPNRPMATTVDVMVLVDNAAFIAHVGDSRVYLLRDGKIFRITEDHTFSERLKRQDVHEPDVLERYEHVLTRSVGGKPQVDVDALFIDIKPGDRILMCTDGLTKYLSGSEIVEFARRRSAGGLLESLVETAKERGGSDNITTVLVAVDEEETDTLRDSARFDTLKQVDILGRIALFQGLDIRELLKFMRVIYERQFTDGETIIEEGESGDCMYIVAEGGVQLSVDGREVAQIGVGENFGEFALVNQAPRSATATAMGETLLLTVPSDRFRENVREDPIVGNKLLWNLLESASQNVLRMTDELTTWKSSDDDD